MRLFLTVFAMGFIFSLPVFAQSEPVLGNVDLILPPALETPDAPFYRGARVKMGGELVPVIEDRLANGLVAQYQPERQAVIINNDSNISENRKGQALMDVVTALQAASVETAAGTEK